MRTLTGNASTKLAQTKGTEWLVILEVEWADGGHVYYSDQEFAGCQPKVVALGSFDTSMQLEGASDSQQLNVVLDDTDGSIREIYNSNDIHKRPAKVYVVEKSTTLNDKVLVFKGELVTPIEWDEEQRSASFSILSKLDSVQVGFSMEEGDFPNIPDEALGKAWPLVFGQVCHLPAVKVRAPRRGYLLGGVGIHDFTLEPRICQALKIQCPSQSTGQQTEYTQGANNTWASNTKDTIGPDLECVNRRFGEICRLKDLLEQQKAYEYDEFEVYNGYAFPQNKKVTIFIDNATFIGTFNGNTFTVQSRKHPEYDTFNHVACRSVPTEPTYGMRQAVAQIGGTNCKSAGGFWGLPINALSGIGYGPIDVTWVSNSTGVSFYPNQTDEQAFQSCDEALVATPGMVGGPKDSWAYYDEMEESNFFWAPAGSEVYMESESEILYIVSLLPGTVDGVAAFRQAPNGFRYLTAVPESYYTVYETDYDGYQVVEIGMNKALSLYNDQWDDNIYVSFTSSVGGNPCDIIEWLVEKYTGLTVDATSFATVKSLLVNYPTNFYLTTRPDVYEVINNIAYQSRCAVYVRNDVLYIKYLAAEPTSLRTLSESDILAGTFKEFLSETDDVYTTHNIAWKKGGAAVREDYDNERELILKYNVTKYGTVEENWDYYCLNHYDLVLKTGTFWLIRKANSWKKATFEVPFRHLDLDVGDCITLDVAQFGGAVKCVIEQMDLNPDDYTITMTVWTPVRSGETSEFYWAWPAAKPCHAVWPLAGDTNGGGGYNFVVSPPIGHILLGGAHRDDQRVISAGGRHPSDLCDVAPEIICELSDYINFDEIEPEILAKEIAQSAARQANENAMTGGGNAGGSKDKKETKSECGVGFGCNYKVWVTWHRSAAQGLAKAHGRSKPGGPCGGPCGCLGGCPSCYGPIWKVCHTFGTTWAARMFANYMKSMYGPNDDGWWECNQTGVLYATPSDGTHTGPFADECPKMSDPGSGVKPEGAEVGGETGTATGLTGEEATEIQAQVWKKAYEDEKKKSEGLK